MEAFQDRSDGHAGETRREHSGRPVDGHHR
jgi:hypothetical protein